MVTIFSKKNEKEQNILKRIASLADIFPEDYTNLDKEQIISSGYKDVLDYFYGHIERLRNFITSNKDRISEIELKILAENAIKNPNDINLLSKIAKNYKPMKDGYDYYKSSDKKIDVDAYALARAIRCKKKENYNTQNLVNVMYTSMLKQNFAIFCNYTEHKRGRPAFHRDLDSDLREKVAEFKSVLESDD